MSRREGPFGLLQELLARDLVELAVDGSGRYEELGGLGAQTRETVLHVLGEPGGERLAFVRLDAYDCELEWAQLGCAIFSPYPLAQSGHRGLLDAVTKADGAQTRPGDLDQYECERQLVPGCSC